MDRTDFPTHAFRSDLARWQHLLQPAWLASLIAGQAVAVAPANGWLLFEAGCGEEGIYQQGHIPGAGYLETCHLEQEPLWNKVSDTALLTCLLGYGIRYDTPVLLYGRNPLAAARVAHLLLYAGVRDVRLLDGGLAAWLRAGLPLEQGTGPGTIATSDFGIPFPACPDYLINTKQARQLLQQPDGALVSIRTWQEHIGAISGYSYIEAKGDILGARWGRAGQDGDVNSMSDYHRLDGTMKPAKEIHRLWAEAGIQACQQVAFYCGTGWRASLAFFYAWLMGWEHISVYDGGWCEWSQDPANPVRCQSSA